MTHSRPPSPRPSQDRPTAPHGASNSAPPLAPEIPDTPLDGLVDLACRDGVDVRPTLLRVLTDLYVQKASHSAFEQIQYVELALGLIDGVDDATRAAVAASLTSYPAAPAAVLDRLAERTVSSRALRHSDDTDREPQSPADIARHDDNTATMSGWTDDAFAREQVARRATLIDDELFANATDLTAPETFTHTAEAADDRTLDTIDDVVGIVPDERIWPDSGAHDEQAPLQDEAKNEGLQDETGDLADLFFFARPEERRLILLSLDAIGSDAPSRAAPASAETVTQLENAALQRRVGDFAATLADALGVHHDIAARIARDPFGEPIVVAAKALAIQAAALQRILLFLNPVVGQSVQRVYELAELYNDISRDAAEQMLAIWQQAGQAATASRQAPRNAAYEPVYDDADRGDSRSRPTTPRRRGAATPARRQKRVKSAS